MSSIRMQTLTTRAANRPCTQCHFDVFFSTPACLPAFSSGLSIDGRACHFWRRCCCLSTIPPPPGQPCFLLSHTLAPMHALAVWCVCSEVSPPPFLLLARSLCLPLSHLLHLLHLILVRKFSYCNLSLVPVCASGARGVGSAAQQGSGQLMHAPADFPGSFPRLIYLPSTPTPLAPLPHFLSVLPLSVSLQLPCEHFTLLHLFRSDSLVASFFTRHPPMLPS